MPSKPKSKKRVYVTLSPDRVEAAYQILGPRRLSAKLDDLLGRWLDDFSCSRLQEGDSPRP